jgi:hypothetical protein
MRIAFSWGSLKAIRWYEYAVRFLVGGALSLLIAAVAHTLRGRLSVALDARGAAMGSLALAGFALLVWQPLPQHPPLGVLGGALSLWIVVSIGLWRLRKLHVLWSRN